MIKIKQIVIASIVLVLLIATFVTLKLVKPNDSTSDNSTDSQSVKLFNHTEKDCKSIILKNENNQYVINNVNGAWEIEGMPSVSKDAISSVVNDIVNISYQNKITENVDDLGAFGLDNPKAQVTIELNDGNKDIFLLGNVTPIPNTFYLKKEGDNSIYTVYSGIQSSINTKFEDKKDTSIDMISTDKITLISLKQKDKKEILLKGIFDSSSNGNNTDKISTITSMSMDNPYANIKLDQSKVDHFIKSITAFSLNEVVEENASDFSKFGFDNPKLELMTMDSNGKALKITAGGQDENGQYYVRINDGKTVYKAFKQLVEDLAINPYELVDKLVYLPQIDEVDNIKIENGSETYTLKLTKQDSKYSYTLNDSNMDQTKGEDLYQSITGLITDGECATDVSLNTVMKITYELKDGKPETVIEFKEYDDNFYRVYVNGTSYFICSRDYIKNIINKLN